MRLCNRCVVLIGIVVMLLSACGGNSLEDEIEECQERCDRINRNPGNNQICLGCRLTSAAQVSSGNDTEVSLQDVELQFAVEADVNADGIFDLVIPRVDSEEVSVSLHNADGTPQAWQDYAVGRSPDHLAVEDMNHDGVADIVVASTNSDTLSVLLGRGNGTFQTVQQWPTLGK